MARVCAQCKFYSEGSETACPQCNGVMQFTLLPPLGQPAKPLLLALPPEPRPSRQQSGPSPFPSLLEAIGWYRRHRLLLSAPIAVIMIVGGLLFGWGKQSVQDRFDHIEVGMDEQEVREILSPPNRGRKWRTPEWYNKPTLSTEGYASLSHNEAGVTVLVEFMDGVVTRKSLKGTETASR
jgi:hypothetical protein